MELNDKIAECIEYSRNLYREVFREWLIIGESLFLVREKLDDNNFSAFVQKSNLSAAEANAYIRLFETIPKDYRVSDKQCDYMFSHGIVEFVEALEAFK